MSDKVEIGDGMIRQYLVEMVGEAREVYIVEAESEDEARANWMNGFHQITEASGMEVVSVRLDD
jgi:hypothetical protein